MTRTTRRISAQRIFSLGAVAGIAFTALAATSPAKADYHLIRWHDTGFCQVWDENIPTAPWPSDYSVVSHQVPTFVDALFVKDHMLHDGACAF
jgi:hypothetical protein